MAYNKPNKYLSIKNTRDIRKTLRDYTKKELKSLIIKLTPLERAPFKYIKERDSNRCRFCGHDTDIEVHHITPKSLGGTNHEFNLITLCKNCHMFIHCNPMGRMCKSELIKSSMVKIDGSTFSKYGKEWGRKSLPKQAINKVLQLKKEYKNLSIRDIVKKVTYYDHNNNKKNISRSAVHKILQEANK